MAQYLITVLAVLIPAFAFSDDTPTPTPTPTKTAIQAVDNFDLFIKSQSGPYTHAVAITPDAYNEVPFVTRGIYVGSAGALQVAPQGAPTPVQFENVPAGTTLGIRVLKVIPVTTGTPAGAIIGMD